MDREDIKWESMDWIHLAQGRDWRRALRSTVMKLRVHKKLEFLGYLSDYQFLKKDIYIKACLWYLPHSVNRLSKLYSS
jgi:hypothetical protein